MPQSLHPDFETNPPGTEYFFLGTGKIQAAVQWSEADGCTPLGFLISNPEHFTRKWSTHLFHPEYGLEKTVVSIIVDGVRFKPNASVPVPYWDFEETEPQLHIEWMAGGCLVRERIRAIANTATVSREFIIRTYDAREIELEVSLYANPAVYSRFTGEASTLKASGYENLRIDVFPEGVFSERTLRVPLRHDGKYYYCRLLYTLGTEAPLYNDFEFWEPENEYWERSSLVRYDDGPYTGSDDDDDDDDSDNSSLLSEIARLYAASATGLRAAVADSGRFDASIWQYGYEWSGDAAMVAEALVYCGQFEVAKKVLTNILTRLTNDLGMAMESSRFRGGMDSELNNNGEILKACCTYLEWTDDVGFIIAHYPRIKAIADYLLRPEFVDQETGMLIAARDIWERNAATGILPGYDIAHQTFAILGLRAAVKLAHLMNDAVNARRWSAAADKMETSFLSHPTHSIIADARIIKRRLLDGSIQTELRPQIKERDFMNKFVPEGMPLSEGGARPWEPDVSEVFPICYGLVDGSSNIATNTLESIETLWSQAWEGGGYGRYNILSEPDSPGPWPFATGYVAAAYLEAGNLPMATRAIEWLIEKAGEGASWFEFYGDRPTPPLPPTGIIVWGWAQFVTLVVRHALGAHLEDGELCFSPKLEGLTGEMRFKDKRVAIE